MNDSREIIGLEKHAHIPDVIIKIWIIGIQLRYVITDLWIFYNAFTNFKLLEYTIQLHLVEGLTCSLVFLFHNTKDCFIFGVMCFLWTIFWCFCYLCIYYEKNIRKKIDLKNKDPDL